MRCCHLEVYIVIPICVLVLAFFFAGLRMDKEYQRGVIFRLGRLKSCKGPGLYWIIPFFDLRVRVDLRVPSSTSTARRLSLGTA